MSVEHKLDYLYASLGDIQSTIRAIDAKASFLLVILFLPLTTLGAIYSKIHALLNHGPWLFSIMAGILAFVFIATWVIGFWFALRTIIAIDNPKHHIDGEQPESTFYPSNLFNLTLWNVIGCTKAMSKVQFRRHFASIPDDPCEIAQQLTVEQMKTTYIAALKLTRSVKAYQATMAWVCVGGAIWIFHLVAI